MGGTNQGSRTVFDDSHTCSALANRQILPLTHPSSSITHYCKPSLSGGIGPRTHKPQPPAFTLALLSWTLVNSDMFHSFRHRPDRVYTPHPLFFSFPGEKTTPAFTLFFLHILFHDDHVKRLHIDRVELGNPGKIQ